MVWTMADSGTFRLMARIASSSLVKTRAGPLGSARVIGSRFTIFDQGDSLGVVRELLRTESTADRRLDAQAVLSRISLWKNAMLRPEEIRAKADDYDQAAKSIYEAYESALTGMHAVDFDDLVTKPVALLRARPGVRHKWRTRFEHILVDEFQDTNVAQLDLVRLLCRSVDKVFADRPELRDRFPDAPPSRGGTCEAAIEFVTDRPGHDRRYAIDSSRIERELGFGSTLAFEAGLGSTVQWFVDHERWWRSVMDESYREWIADQYGEQD